MYRAITLACALGLVGGSVGPTRGDGKPVQDEVAAHLAATKTAFQRGQEDYYARLALEQALEAYREGNYAIGAIVLYVTDSRIYEFRARNMMVKGSGVADHAEARGLMVARNHAIASGFIKGRALDPWVSSKDLPTPVVYGKDENEHTKRLVNGLHCYGTLEPCPMCLCMMLNSGIKVSISSAGI